MESWSDTSSQIFDWKLYFTGSPVFSINLTYLKIATNPNYLMSIKKSQAILKCFIDLKFSVWFTLGSENETLFCDTWNFFQLPLSSFLVPRSSFLFPLSSFLVPLSSFLFPLSSFLFPLSSFRFPLSSFSTYLGKIEATLLAG